MTMRLPPAEVDPAKEERAMASLAGPRTRGRMPDLLALRERRRPDLVVRVLAGLRDLPVKVVMTVGRHIDPAEFGPRPAHVHVARYIPQASVLPHCALGHGGSGSVLGALAHGIPSVLLPLGADRPHNAARCAAAVGVCRMLDPLRATPRDVRDAATAVLADPAYRQAAERLRDEIAAQPGPEHERRPLPASPD